MHEKHQSSTKLERWFVDSFDYGGGSSEYYFYGYSYTPVMCEIDDDLEIRTRFDNNVWLLALL